MKARAENSIFEVVSSLSSLVHLEKSPVEHSLGIS